MAKLIVTEEQVAAMIPLFDAAGADMRQIDIYDEDVAAEMFVATDTSAAEWIEAQGEPTKRIGAVLVWDKTRLVPTGRGNRVATVGDIIYVLSTGRQHDGREVTVAVVERA